MMEEPDLLEPALEASASSCDAQIFTLADPPFVITHVNDAWVLLCGYSRAEAVGNTCRILQGPETGGEALNSLHLAARARRPISVCLLNYTKAGVPFFNQLRVRPLRETASRDVTHYVGTLRAYKDLHSLAKRGIDRTEWQQPTPSEPEASTPQAFQTAEDEAKSDYMKMRVPTTLQEALHVTDVPQVITEAVPPFRIVHVNDTWCGLCGYAAEEVFGLTCKILQGPGTCPSTLEALKAAALLQVPIGVRLVNYSKDGRPFLNILQMAPLLDAEGGRVTHLTALIRAKFLDSPALNLITPPLQSFDAPQRPPLQTGYQLPAAAPPSQPPQPPPQPPSQPQQQSMHHPPLPQHYHWFPSDVNPVVQQLAANLAQQMHPTAPTLGGSAPLPMPMAGAPSRMSGGCATSTMMPQPPMTRAAANASASGLLPPAAPSFATPSPPEDVAKSDYIKMRLPTTLQEALHVTDVPQVITEAVPPFRIVHVNDTWCGLCGYAAEEVFGLTCKILQGPGTCPSTLEALKAAALLQVPIGVRLVNYSKDGRPFLNILQMAPLLDAEGGRVTHLTALIRAKFLDSPALNLITPPLQSFDAPQRPPLQTGYQLPAAAPPSQPPQPPPQPPSQPQQQSMHHPPLPQHYHWFPSDVNPVVQQLAANLAHASASGLPPPAVPSFVTPSPPDGVPMALPVAHPIAELIVNSTTANSYEVPASRHGACGAEDDAMPPPTRPLPDGVGQPLHASPRLHTLPKWGAPQPPPPPPQPDPGGGRATMHDVRLCAPTEEAHAPSAREAAPTLLPPSHDGSAAAIAATTSAAARAGTPGGWGAATAGARAERGAAVAAEDTGRPDVAVDGRLAPFLSKLFTMATSADTSDAIRWSANGSAVEIVDASKLSREVLPRFFKHNKIGTFTQQLYTCVSLHPVGASPAPSLPTRPDLVWACAGTRSQVWLHATRIRVAF